MNLEVKENEDRNRFEAEHKGHTAFIDYKMQDETYNLVHTEVPSDIGEKGVGTELVKQTLDTIKEKEKYVKPSCPFIAHFIKENSDYKSLVK